MTKRTFDIPAKRRERKKFRRFIKKTVLKHKKAEDIKYLSLTGVEGIEIIEVTDRLGIPRKNIVSCERNKKLARELKRRFPKIAVVNMDIVDYLKRTKRKFDVINLDFCGNMTSKVVKSYEYISVQRILNDGGVIASTFLGARENKEVKSIMRSPLIGIYGSQLLSENSLEKSLDTMDKMVDILLGNEDDRIYRKGIPLRIIYTSFFGKHIRENHEDEYLESLESVSNLYKRLVDMSEAGETTVEIDKIFKSTKNSNGMTDEEVLRWEGMFTKKAEAYKYISDNNSPMINYIFQFEYNETLHSRRIFSRLNDAFLELEKTIPDIVMIDKPKGCSNTTKITKTVIVKKEKKNAARKMTDKVKEGVLKMLSEGLDIEEIKKSFDVTKSQIAALKAWKTMGKYS
tara:strand:+ start:283 stop:1485 length:1203 start_codon:yes stop_codon:yes gene_type:complete